jgi:hypothetical protein
MNIYDCLRLPLGDVPAECIERFDCGREDINNFFHHDVERNVKLETRLMFFDLINYNNE